MDGKIFNLRTSPYMFRIGNSHMPIMTREIIWDLWDALENNACLAVWQDGETTLIPCGEEGEFEGNDPLVILDPADFMEETATRDHALEDGVLHEAIGEIITNAGGDII
jgi:hypothetical protein